MKLKLAVVFFQTEAGREPVREWLADLTKEDRRIIGGDLLVVQAQWPLGKPLVDHLGAGLWEVRSSLPNREARVIFILTGSKMVLLHGFIKKQPKTPPHELEIVRRRKRLYETGEVP